VKNIDNVGKRENIKMLIQNISNRSLGWSHGEKKRLCEKAKSFVFLVVFIGSQEENVFQT